MYDLVQKKDDTQRHTIHSSYESLQTGQKDLRAGRSQHRAETQRHDLKNTKWRERLFSDSAVSHRKPEGSSRLSDYLKQFYRESMTIGSEKSGLSNYHESNGNNIERQKDQQRGAMEYNGDISSADTASAIPVQMKTEGSITASGDSAQQADNTKLPTHLKSEYEQKSGLSFDDVRVYYNSDKPAGLGALAYTQGNRIHIGPGQEKHLRHELGHVVQQKRGEVTLTGSINGLPVNEDRNLEREATQIPSSPTQNVDKHTDGISHADVIQKQDVFAQIIGNAAITNDEIIDQIVNAVEASVDNPTAKINRISGLLDDLNMNFNKLNAGEANLLEQPPVSEATIRQYIQKEMDEIGNTTLLDQEKKQLKMGAAVNGIARALATKLGDLKTAGTIATMLLEKLRPSMQLADKNNFDRVSVYSQDNPVLQYLHDEINAHDAAMLICKRAVEMNPVANNADAQTLFNELTEQARLRVKAMRSLNDDPSLNVSTRKTRKLAIDDPFGLYTKEFLDATIPDPTTGAWSSGAQAKVDKIRLKLQSSAFQNPAAVTPKYTLGQGAIAKASRHTAKMYRTGTTDIENTKEATAIANVKILLGITDDSVARNALQKMVDRLQNADITITRFADGLLGRDLAAGGGVLRPGTGEYGMDLSELVNETGPIRLGSPTGFYQARERQPGDFGYTPLLSTNNAEGAERKTTYPIFRQFKNHLFAGKPAEGAERATFGSLCFDPQGAKHGFKQNAVGTETGTYGNTTLVLNDTVKNRGNVIYTNTDRGRGYTDLKAFVYSLFQSSDIDKSFVLGGGVEKGEQFVRGSGNRTLPFGVPRALLELVCNSTPVGPETTQNLEVQIFMDVQLSKEHIKDVYFASDVPEPQRNEIKTRINANGAASANPTPVGYHRYKGMEDPRLRYALDNLYDKKSGPPREKISEDQLKQLMKSRDLDKDMRDNYSQNATSSWFSPWLGFREGGVFAEAKRQLESYLADPTGDI